MRGEELGKTRSGECGFGGDVESRSRYAVRRGKLRGEEESE